MHRLLHTTGTWGGVWLGSRSQLTLSKKRCCFIRRGSARRSSGSQRRRRMRSAASAANRGSPGIRRCRGHWTTRSWVSSAVWATKGGRPTSISYKITPTDHQSQAWLYSVNRMEYRFVLNWNANYREWDSVSFPNVDCPTYKLILSIK